MLSVLSSYLDQTPVPLSTPLSPFLSLLCLARQLTTWPSIFLLQQWAKEKNKVERRRKTSLPHPEMLLLSCLLCLPHPSIPPPRLCSASAFKLQSSSVWLTFAASTHWGSSCSTSATAARINGRQLKQITFIVITPHVSHHLSLSFPALACPHLPCVLSVWLIRKLCCILCALCSFYRVWVGVWLPTAAAIWLHI